jgi:hypothetical protein
MWTWIKLVHDSGHRKDLVSTVLEALGSTISDELLEEVNDYQLLKKNTNSQSQYFWKANGMKQFL